MFRKKFIQTKRNLVLPIIQLVIPIAILTMCYPEPENLPALELNLAMFEETTTFLYYNPTMQWSVNYKNDYQNSNTFAKEGKNKLVVLTKVEIEDDPEGANDTDKKGLHSNF